MKWKKNDWCFCEFKLQMIKEVKEGKPTEVSTGHICMSGSDLSDRCYPMTLQSKINSENVERISDKIHKMRNNTINYPQLNRILIEKWQEICDAGNDNKVLEKLFTKLYEWEDVTLKRLKNLEHEKQTGAKYE